MSKQAILQTLHYADLFDYPLRFEEIHTYLVEPLKIDVLKEILSQIDADPTSSFGLRRAGSYYCLPGRGKIIELRKKRQVWSRPKLEKAKRVVSILKFIPWMKLIAVTGALAVGNSDEGDDIDLMIITARKRLWLTRGLVVMFLLLTGQYRRPGKVKDRICPNLMISEGALEFPEQDLFTAHEIVQMKPIFERDNAYQRFVNANRWVRKFLPNTFCHPEHQRRISERAKRVSDKLRDSSGFALRMTFGKPFSILETLAYKLQLKFMESKRTTEVTTPSVIRFHPQDTRRRVLDEYQKRVYDLPK